jgi:uncharacterized protein (DUF2147 family)
MKNAIVLLVFCLLVTATAVSAFHGDDILGVWNNEEKDAKIEIFKCSGKYCGKIVFAKEPNYPAGSKEGVPGTPRLDHNNPDAAKRSTLILGLLIVKDFIFDGEEAWKGGTVYDPKNGKTYRGKITLVSPDKLNLRGFVGIPLFGRTTTWTK